MDAKEWSTGGAEEDAPVPVQVDLAADLAAEEDLAAEVDLVKAVWDAAAFPLHAAADGDDDIHAVLATDDINHIYHRSLASAVALANETSKSFALRVMAPWNVDAIDLVRLACRLPVLCQGPALLADQGEMEEELR